MKFYGLDEIRAAKTGVTRTALAGARALREAVSVAWDRGMSREQVEKIEREAKDALILDIVDARKEDIARLEGELEAVRSAHAKNYERKRSEHEAEIRDAERKFRAMNPRELWAEALGWMKGERGVMDPRVLDAMSIALKEARPEEYEPFREVLLKRRYNDPATLDGTGKVIFEDIEQFRSTTGADVPAKTRAGVHFTESIESITDMLALEKGDPK
jgi:hypothetical protein